MSGKRIYPDEVFEKILERISQGEAVTTIVQDEGMPAYSKVLDRFVQPEWREKYARAREMQGDYYAERISDVMDEIRTTDDAQMARVKIDALKWLAGKRKPKTYGDKVEQEHTGGVTIKVVTGLDVD